MLIIKIPIRRDFLYFSYSDIGMGLTAWKKMMS